MPGTFSGTEDTARNKYPCPLELPSNNGERNNKETKCTRCLDSVEGYRGKLKQGRDSKCCVTDSFIVSKRMIRNFSLRQKHFSKDFKEIRE